MEKSEIVATPKSSVKSSVLDKWLTVLAANFSVDLSALQVAAYREGVKDLPDEDLDAAFRYALLECERWPTVATLRKYASGKPASKSEERTLCAEVEWDALSRHCERFGETLYPSDPKLELSSAGEYALRIIGGRRGVLSGLSDPDKLYFRHKAFVEAWTYYLESRRLQQLTDVVSRARLPAPAKETPRPEEA